MPYLPTVGDISSDNGGSTAGSLAALITIAIKQASRLRGSPAETTGETNPAFLEGTRIPISEIDNLSTPRRKKRSTGRLKNSSGVLIEKHALSDESMPQPLTDSIPVVHDRLPDPKMWEKLKLGQDVDIQEIIDISQSPNQTPVDKSLTTTTKDVLQHEVVHNLSKRNIPPKLEGITRRKQLYCRNGFHLEILQNGKVQGTLKDHSRYAILEFVSIRAGLITIRGVETGRYLAMDRRGQLYGSDVLTKQCFFRENFEEHRYNTYSTVRHRGHSKTKDCYVAITQHGQARPGCRSKRHQKVTHFLPRPVEWTKVKWQYQGEYS